MIQGGQSKETHESFGKTDVELTTKFVNLSEYRAVYAHGVCKR